MSADLARQLAGLLEPVRPGDEVTPGVRFVGSSTELGLRLTFELEGHVVHVEVGLLSDTPRFAARTARLALSYRAGRGSAGDHLSPGQGKALCERIAPVVARNEARVLDAIEAAARRAEERSVDSTRIAEVRVEALLERAEWRGTRYYTVSPYVGCLIGCRFCYAQSRVASVRRLEGRDEPPWGSYVDVRINAAEVLARELAELPIGPIKFCPIVSDPYHAVERRFAVTRACLEAIRHAERPFPTMVLTRSELIERDAELIGSLPVAYAGVSIPTIDDEVRRHFEPRAAPVEARLRVLESLRARGARTFAVVQPLLPGPIDALADALAARVDSISIDVLESLERAEADFAAPRFVLARERSWQIERALELEQAMRDRGVPAWRGELPPELCASTGGAAGEP